MDEKGVVVENVVVVLTAKPEVPKCVCHNAVTKNLLILCLFKNA